MSDLPSSQDQSDTHRGSKTALLIIDVQNDFLPPDGSLAVPGGREILPVISDLLDISWDWDAVVVSQDYHPSGHISFASTHSGKPFDNVQLKNARGDSYEQTLWPDHCVQGTKGAEIEKGLRGELKRWNGKTKLVRKGVHPLMETYSAFEGYITEAVDPAEPPNRMTDVPPKAVSPVDTELGQYLKAENIGKVLVVGLAFDYCVLASVLGATSAFPTAVLGRGTRAVDVSSQDEVYKKIESAGGVVMKGEGDQWKEEVRGWLNT